MALAQPHVQYLLEIARSNLFKKPKIKIMEFGEQNWFGDVPVMQIAGIAKFLNLPEERVAKIEQQIKDMIAEYEKGDVGQKNKILFQFAELYYNVLFNVEAHHAIDLHGTAKATRKDLNHPLELKEKYDLVVNFGTGEHVFNQYMFHKNLHDVCEKDGFIIHSMPNQGCYDHGFYNFHPTFLFDLAAFNKYNILGCTYVDLKQKPAQMVTIDRVKYVQMAIDGQLSNYSALFVIFQKTTDEEFVIPQQGYYGNHLPEELRKAWEKLDR